MEFSPNDSPAALPLPRRRPLRVRLLWGAFVVATIATVFAVRRLYETVRRELQEQAEVALRQQEVKLRDRVHAVTDEARHDLIRALAAFHVEGLGFALRQWDERNATVIGTFQWDETQGFLPGVTFPPGVKSDELPALWREFRASRSRHPDTAMPDVGNVGSFRTSVVRTLDNPLFPPAELGYQAENIDLMNDAARPVDPWAGWAGEMGDSASPWVMWYQIGPGAAVRGCFIDFGPMVDNLRREFADPRLARVQILPSGNASAAVNPSLVDGAGLASWLPGFVITGSHGDLFVEKQGEARLAALTIVPLLGLFVMGAVFLARFSQRELRDAERKTTFVTQVSHELRTPLTSIRMFADMLGAPDLPESKRTRFAGTISRESERLGALIERLLMFNTLATGGARAVIAAVDVRSVVTETLEEMEEIFFRAGMNVEPTIPPGPVLAACDRSALKQALLNLFENALKYAREGGVVRVLLAREDREGVRLCVADEGPGIPRELGTRVFEPFVQGGQTLIDKSPGVGLGLSIARGLLRQAGGDLVLVPAEKGAVFEIRLRAASIP